MQAGATSQLATMCCSQLHVSTLRCSNIAVTSHTAHFTGWCFAFWVSHLPVRNAYQPIFSPQALLSCRALGKSFFKKKKVPIPVNLQAKDWSAQIQKALSGTYLNKNGGNCLSIRYTSSQATPLLAIFKQQHCLVCIRMCVRIMNSLHFDLCCRT